MGSTAAVVVATSTEAVIIGPLRTHRMGFDQLAAGIEAIMRINCIHFTTRSFAAGCRKRA